MTKKLKIIIALIVIIGGGMIYQYVSTGTPPISVSSTSRPQGTVGNYEIVMDGGSGFLNSQTNNFTVSNTSSENIPALKASDITLMQNNKVIPSNEYSVNISSDNGTYKSGQGYGLEVSYNFKNDTKYPITLVVKSGNEQGNLSFKN